MKAVHIHLSYFENESRILKETKSLVDEGVMDEIVVMAMWKEGLLSEERIDLKRRVVRNKTQFPWPRYVKGALYYTGMYYFIVRRVEKLWSAYSFLDKIRREKPDYINIHQVVQLRLMPYFRFFMKNVKFIYDTHELETETSGLTGRIKRREKRIERKYIKKFTHIFVVSPSIENWYREEYKLNNVSSVRNCPYYQEIGKNNLFREEFGIPKESIIFIYQGGLYNVRGVDVILECFKQINDRKFAIVFMGYGECEEDIKSAALYNHNIFYKPAVSPDSVLKYTSSADVGIHMIKNTCLNHYYCLPNKLFEYLMGGIPSIVPDLRDMSDFVHERKVGYVLKQYSVEGLKDIVTSVTKEQLASFQENIKATKKKYNWNEEGNRMTEIYKNFIKEDIS